MVNYDFMLTAALKSNVIYESVLTSTNALLTAHCIRISTGVGLLSTCAVKHSLICITKCTSPITMEVYKKLKEFFGFFLNFKPIYSPSPYKIEHKVHNNKI